MESGEILEIPQSTDRYNLHSHTQFCDGRAPMLTMTEAAVAAGMAVWGFSPHSPVPFASPCNMDAADVPSYIAEVERLRSIFGDRIRLYASMEIDYLDGSWGPAHEYFLALPLDYRIGSVHFVPSANGFVDVDGSFESFKGKMARYFDNDIRHVVELFYRQSTAMVEAGGFDIIGHLDKIGHNASLFQLGIEDTPWYGALVEELIHKVLEKHVTVEVNTKAYESAGRLFPNSRYLSALIAEGADIVVNSDAHYPDKVNLGRDAAIAMIREIRNNL